MTFEEWFADMEKRYDQHYNESYKALLQECWEAAQNAIKEVV